MIHSPALFLDRDGVINIDHGYVYKKEDFEFVEGIFEFCRTAKQFGYLIFVITNQAGIGRGFYTEEDFLKITDWMCNIFRDNGIVIDKVYYCPFHPVHGVGHYKTDSPNRKPRPGMIFQANEEFTIDLAKSVLIGDKETDIEAGVTAGVGCNVLYNTMVVDNSVRTGASAVINSLLQAEQYLSDHVGKFSLYK